LKAGGPRPCLWCEQDLALVGKGLPYCAGCWAARNPRKYEPTAQEQADHELEEERMFAEDHSWESDNGDLNEGRAVGPVPGYFDKW